MNKFLWVTGENIYRIRVYFLILFLLQLSHIVISQKIDVEADSFEDKIVIHYKLISINSNQTYDIKILYSMNREDKFYEIALNKLKGDVGANITGIGLKRVVWDITKETLFTNTNGEIWLTFKVRAEASNKKGYATNNIDMIYIKGGSFEMGAEIDLHADENPVHDVLLNDFYIGKFEVTQAQWQEIMQENPSKNKFCDNCPVEQVSWDDVQVFITKLNEKTGLNYRLPTEAEWEYAAKGGYLANNKIYAGSNEVDNVAWYGYEKSGTSTHVVGKKNANEVNLYDMSGNVWEWCSDWYNKDYYHESKTNNPQGPKSGTKKVIRGGSWALTANSLRVTNREGYIPYSIKDTIGFRLAMDK